MSEALRLADALEQQFPIGTAQHYLDGEAAAELRRLHAENETLKKSLKESLYYAMGQASALRELNAELAEALRRCRDMVAHPDNLAFIDAALAKVQGESK